MTPKDLFTAVQQIADTQPSRSKITAADVSRSISLTFGVLSQLPAAEAMETIAKLLKNGSKADLRKGKTGQKKAKKKSVAKKK